MKTLDDWPETAQATHIPSDSLAVIRTAKNALAWHPVFLDEEGRPCVQIDSKWQLVEATSGFDHYERVRTKQTPASSSDVDGEQQ